MSSLSPSLAPKPNSTTPTPVLTPNSISPAPSRRHSDSGMETAAKTVVLFPGSGTVAAATLGALGSVAAVATGGVALLGAGAAVCAFKFSPSLNKESCQRNKEEKERAMEHYRKEAEELQRSKSAAENVTDDTLATVLSARDNHW
eukprot:TRINITY_DN76876_c0_g1_i1.p1 TRINITY_DN76876_c0_g1~~TRINITY_DN76876_c0_g1_i1.p1  ORF type:complete len:145 (+),score=56.02 TRINITY_DN76876_c0_g1_i1:174-608(+)